MDDIFDDPFDAPFPKRRKRKAVVPLAPEEEQGIVSKLAGATMSGLGSLFNVLDLPASSLRDIVSGNNPLDQWLDPFGSEADKNRASGRDVLSTWGLADKNKETGIIGWLDDPGDGLQDIAGFGLEVATDPLGWLAKGAKALTKTGQAAREAGLLQKAIKQGDAAGMGPRESLMKATPRQLTNPLPAGALGPQTDDFLRFEQAAKARGLDPLKELDTPLSGLYGVVKPFGVDPFTTIGKAGGLAEKIAKTKDKIGASLRYGEIPGTGYSPGRHWASLFSAPVEGTRTTKGQKFAADVYDAVDAGHRESRAFTTEHALGLDESVLPLPTIGDPVTGSSRFGSRVMRQMGESASGVPYDARLDPSGALKAVQEANARNLEENARRGLRAKNALDDDGLQYLARQSTVPSVVKQFGGGKPFASVEDLAAKKRSEIFKGFQGGTEQVNDLMTDPEIKRIIETAQPSDARRRIADHIRSKWGPQGVRLEWVETLKSGKLRKHDQAEGLADFIYSHPDVTENGLFNRHFLADAHAKIQSDVTRQKISDVTFDWLANPDNTQLVRTLKPGEKPQVRVGSVLKKLGYELGPATDRILERQGVDVLGLQSTDPKFLDAMRKGLRNQWVERDVASDIVKAASRITVPNEIGDLAKGIDSFTTLFKAGVLTHPARYVRDTASGQFRNFERGEFSWTSARDAKNLMLGQTVEGADRIPAVKRWLAERGQPLSPENATRALKIIYGSLTGGKNLKTELAGSTAFGEGIEAMLASIPGKKPTTIGGAIRDTLQDAKDKGSWKPWEIEGFGSQAETKFKPVRVGNALGNATDTSNRLVPWLEKLKAGADPVAAMEQVSKSQVDYSPRTFTALERQLKRVFPFYSFGSRQAKYVANELMQHPGGRMGQAIRATASGQNPDEIVPDSIADTATIPIGTLPDGSKRYLTGFGLMHEDPLGFLGGGVRGAGLELLSRSNPLIKGPLEWATGQSFFQKGPDGGRPLEDLDPTIGRIISNISGEARPARTPAWLEAIAGNSPLSRVLTTARTVTDSRKHDLAGLANILSGVRVADISPQAQDAQIREATQAALKKLGSRTFQKVFVPEEIRDKMDPSELRAVAELESLLNELARRTKTRKEQKEKSNGR